MVRLLLLFAAFLTGVHAGCGAEVVAVSAAETDSAGFLVHEVTSPYQAGTTQIRVLLPDRLETKPRYPVVYVLPVEAGRESHYGDGLLEIKNHDLANVHGAIFVAPTFSHLPWYADHPSDPAIRQETFFLQVVLPEVEAKYPASVEPRDRLLLGFSKSGWGAWSLLLRHPELFGKAAAWDAPLMMDQPGRYGSGEIFGTPANFRGYHVSQLVRDNSEKLGDASRLVLLGYDNFAAEHRQMHTLLDKLQVRHDYRDGPQRKHNWHSGWVSEAVEWLLGQAPAQAQHGSPAGNATEIASRQP